MIDNVIDHIIHFAEIVPDGIKHIGIGADFDGCDKLPIELKNSCKVEILYNKLIERGLTSEEAEGILFYNLYHYFKRNI